METQELLLTALRAAAVYVFYVKGPGAITGEFERIPYQRRNLNYWPHGCQPLCVNGVVE